MSGTRFEGVNGARLTLDAVGGFVDLLAYTVDPAINGTFVRLSEATAERLLDALAFELGLGEDATAQLRLAAEEREGEPCAG